MQTEYINMPGVGRMAWLSRLKDSNYYINFDEGCVYCGNTIVAEISSPTHMKILKHFSTNPKQWLSSDSIIDNCWPDHYAAPSTFYSTISKLKGIHPEVDKSIDSKKGMGYRYLGQKRECCDVESVQKEQSTPALPIGTDEEILPYDALLSEIECLSHQMYSLVGNLEEIQRKISIATNSKNLIWEEIYETQFKAVYFQFNRLQAELAEKQNQIEKVKQLTERCDIVAASGNHSPKVIACMPTYTMSMLHEVQVLTNCVAEMQVKTNSLALEVDELIYEYMSGAIDVKELQEILSQLPCNRNTALALLSLTNSFDMFELYEVIFTEYIDFLSEDERAQIKEKAQKIFASCLLETWGLCE